MFSSPKLKFLENPNTVAKIIAIVVAFLFLLPYLLANGNAYLKIHDTLEGEWIWIYKLLANNSALNTDSSAMVPDVLGGIPRFMYPTGINVNFLFVSVFGVYWGYILSSVFIHATAFLGVYFLSIRYFFKEDKYRFYAIYAAVVFALIPFFVPFGISVAGQPLLLLAILNIWYGKTNSWEYLYLVFLPFYTSIVWAAPFYNLAILVLVAILYYKERRNPLKLVLGVFAMNILYVLLNYHTVIYSMLFSDVVNHRVEYDPLIEWNASILANLGETLYIFFLGHYHVGMLVALPILLLGMFCWKQRKIKVLLTVVVIISAINGFYLYLIPVLEWIHPLLLSFVVKRANVLQPFLWIMILLLVIDNLKDKIEFQKLLVFVMCNMIFIGFFANDEIINNYRNLLGFQKKPGFKEFFDAELYQSINSFIGKDKSDYRVASLGVSPSIAQFNDFQTIDGIQSLYPLEHKHLMQNIMEKEFEKSEELKNYFVAWGNRCYLFSAELGIKHNSFMIDSKQSKSVESLDLNTEFLKEAKVAYIFSAVLIKNNNNGDLELLDSFVSENDFWKIYLYKVI